MAFVVVVVVVVVAVARQSWRGFFRLQSSNKKASKRGAVETRATFYSGKVNSWGGEEEEVEEGGGGGGEGRGGGRAAEGGDTQTTLFQSSLLNTVRS